MVIAKGEPWGHPGELPTGSPVACGDAAASSYVASRDTGSEVNTIGLQGGDLARTLGMRPPYDPASAKQLVPVDALEIELADGTEHHGLAHVVVGNIRWGREPVALMNAAFIGSRNIAPRAHPGDGKVDVVRMHLDLTDRVKAWKRMVTGTHVPHPDIEIRQRQEGLIELDRPQRIRVDGRLVGRSATVRYRVVPSAIIVAVS